jgi:DNA transformation protein and related proteins
VPVTDGFRDFVIEQLEHVARDIRAKRMFGAIGIYCGDDFFAVIDDDRLYFKVDDQTRPKYEAEGMQPARLRPDQIALGYWEVPLGALESPDELKTWVKDAVAVAQRAAARRPARRQSKTNSAKSTSSQPSRSKHRR